MVNHNAAAVLDVLDERFPSLLGPRVALVVADHDVVGLEVGLEAAHVGAFGRRGGHIHRKEAGFLQELLQDRRRRLPVVPILTVDDQRLVRWRAQRDGRHEEQNQRRHPVLQRHDLCPFFLSKGTSNGHHPSVVAYQE
jgi:hypothetical protein